MMGKIEKVKCKFDNISSIYEGEVKNNKFNGYGILKSSQGIYYEGNFKDNKLEGKGIYTNISNTFNEFHIDNIMTGKEKKRFEKFHKKLGYTTENMPEALDNSGRHTSKGGERIVGFFKNNKIYGFSDIFSPNGDYVRVCYDNGKIDGIVKVLKEEGSMLEFEQWKNGVTFDDENFHYTEQIYYKKEKKFLKRAQNSFVRTFEREFKEHGWYPHLLCSNKDEFQEKLKVWKERYKPILFKK